MWPNDQMALSGCTFGSERMSDDVKERLRQMRSENRKIATDNRQLLAELQQVQAAFRELTERQKADATQVRSELHAATKQITAQRNHQIQMRMGRRRRIITEVRKQSDENKRLMTDVHGLQAEIQRITQVYEAHPSRFRSKLTPRTQTD
jgi:thiamine pyrophosphate-dependent acetolactate synthase large subunit-like protein